MTNFNDYAYSSKLKEVQTRHKLFFCMTALLTHLWADYLPTSILILLLMSWHTLYKGGISYKIYFKMLLLPLSFLLMSTVVIALPLTQASLYQAFHLFFKSFGALSCLYYLSLTTPFVSILNTLAKWKIPLLFIELMSLMYRFIFILLETCHHMLIAQKVRLGYSTYQTSLRSFSKLFATLFIHAFKRATLLYTALEARGYDGELKFIEEPVKQTSSHYLFSCLGQLFILLLLTLFFKTTNGGFLT
jgi:cobalt/nickel transport system permease protein